MSVWKRARDLPRSDAYSDHVELFVAPSGAVWARYRLVQEMAELRVLRKEHHPTEERLDRAAVSENAP